MTTRAVADLQRQLDLRVAQAEGLPERWDDEFAGRRRRRQAQPLAEGSAASRTAAVASSSVARIRSAWGRKAAPAAVGRRPRPSRSTRRSPISFDRAARAPETDDWVTTSSWLARVTEPVRTTVTNVRSSESVTATRRTGGRGRARPTASRPEPADRPPGEAQQQLDPVEHAGHEVPDGARDDPGQGAVGARWGRRRTG